MLDQLEQIKREALSSLEAVQEDEALAQWKVAQMGKSSPLMATFDDLRDMPKEERPAIGRGANQVKQALEASYEAKSDALRAATVLQSLEKEHLDVTLPGRPFLRGRLHPTTQTMRRIYGVFAEMGFQNILMNTLDL